MPYMIVNSGEKFCVHKKNPDNSRGERIACHDTRDKAQRQIAAMYASENSKALNVFKTMVDKNGELRWVAWSSNAYRDRDVNPVTGGGEIVSLSALKLWTAYAEKTGEYGPLLWVHNRKMAVGNTDISIVRGAFLVESGTFADSTLGRKAASYLANYDGEFGPLGVSIGFECDPVERASGVYQTVMIKERSVLPVAIAANPYTQFSAVLEEL